jgi:hypothetical protein
MAASSDFIKVQSGIYVNLANVTYIEVTGRGGIDIHFMGKATALHLSAAEAEPLKEYLAGEESVNDITKAA